MTLLENWRNAAYYDKSLSKAEQQNFWNTYFLKEKGFYETLLSSDEIVTGTIPELAEKYGVDGFTMVGIMDGIDESLVNPNPLETMDNETVLSLEYDKELLYKNMVLAGAEWLYKLPIWNEIFTEEKQDELYKEAKKSNTVVKGAKVYPNDPCPCGSGKKYKKCCGRNR